MKPISASGSIILFLITALSVKAGSLANDALPHREASLTSVDVQRQNEGKRAQRIKFCRQTCSSCTNALKEEVAQCEENAESAEDKVTELETQLQALREELRASNEQLSQCNDSRFKIFEDLQRACKENTCNCEFGYAGEDCNKELNLCETFPERKPKDQFGCYRVGATNKTIPKCWRKCKYDWKNGCGQHRWCHIDNSKCTLSQYKKAACVKKWWLDDRGACPKRWNKYYCDERVGVSYACGDGIWRCWRSCDKGELGCKSSGYCYADNGAGYRKDCSLDKSCKIVTEYPCL